MKKSDILKAFLIIADQIGEVTLVSTHDTWVSVHIEADDGTKYSLEFNIIPKKEEETDGN